MYRSVYRNASLSKMVGTMKGYLFLALFSCILFSQKFVNCNGNSIISGFHNLEEVGRRMHEMCAAIMESDGNNKNNEVSLLKDFLV